LFYPRFKSTNFAFYRKNDGEFILLCVTFFIFVYSDAVYIKRGDYVEFVSVVRQK